MKKAVYAGSFDPMTLGHVDIIKQGLILFDDVTVLIAENKKKQGFLPKAVRQEIILKGLDVFTETEKAFNEKRLHVDILDHEDLVVDYCSRNEIWTMIRGLRDVTDFDYERQIKEVNHRLNPFLMSVYLLCDQRNSFISSSIVRVLAELNKPYDDLVAPGTADIINKSQGA